MPNFIPVYDRRLYTTSQQPCTSLSALCIEFSYGSSDSKAGWSDVAQRQDDSIDVGLMLGQPPLLSVH